MASDTKRCFIAVPVLSPAAISELNRTAKALAAFGDFRKEPAYHVTLQFLGDVLPVTAETLGCWIRNEPSKYPSLRLGCSPPAPRRAPAPRASRSAVPTPYCDSIHACSSANRSMPLTPSASYSANNTSSKVETSLCVKR